MNKWGGCGWRDSFVEVSDGWHRLVGFFFLACVGLFGDAEQVSVRNV